MKILLRLCNSVVMLFNNLCKLVINLMRFIQ
jgi:hypothetical protein